MKVGLVLIVRAGAEQRKEWVILRIQERFQLRCVWIESWKKWIGAHNAGGWEDIPVGLI